MPVSYWEDLTVGTVVSGDEVPVDRDEMVEYALKNDPLPFHTSEEAAEKSHFGGLVASGGFTISLWYRSMIPVMGSIALRAGYDFKMTLPTPVRPGDRLQNHVEIIEQEPSSKPGQGHVVTRQALVNQDKAEVLVVEVRWLISRRPAA
jgi:acyl dehydratase